MNKQTRSLRQVNVSSKVQKGVSVPKDGMSGVGQSLTFVEFAPTKGRFVDSSKERADKGRKPWKGVKV